MTYTENYINSMNSNTPSFSMIDNYIYLYHTSTFIVIPTFPESLTDNMPASYSQTPIMGRSAPIYSYSNSGPRSIDFRFTFHRDMMNQINTSAHTTISPNIGMSLFTSDSDLEVKLQRKDYVDLMINELQSIAFPSYAVSEKMVNPPLVAIRIGDEIFCKGVVDGGVSVQYSGPILANPEYDVDGNIKYTQDLNSKNLYHRSEGKGKYALVEVSFKVTEVDPYDAYLVAQQGSMRGLNRTLERNLYKGNS